MEEVDARAIAQEALELYRPAAPNIAFHLDTPPAPVPVSCDATRVQQVLNNLLSNAVKYSGGCGDVVIAVEHDLENVAFSVRDRGPGIAESELGRLFERATGLPPFAVPQRWNDARAALDLTTPVNLSTSNDIVGGNSGSPLLDADGRIVGLMFDGNIHSISGSYWFDAEKNRAVAVHPAIIREALAKVYEADALLAELEGTD